MCLIAKCSTRELRSELSGHHRNVVCTRGANVVTLEMFPNGATRVRQVDQLDVCTNDLIVECVCARRGSNWHIANAIMSHFWRQIAHGHTLTAD